MTPKAEAAIVPAQPGTAGSQKRQRAYSPLKSGRDAALPTPRFQPGETDFHVLDLKSKRIFFYCFKPSNVGNCYSSFSKLTST